MLEKFTSLLEKFLMPITNYMNSNKYICAIRDAFSIIEYFTKKMTAFHSFDDVITLV